MPQQCEPAVIAGDIATIPGVSAGWRKRTRLPTLTFLEKPRLKSSILVTALSGWPDAAEGATRAVRELVRLLPATRFAEIDPEEFFDFSRTRPVVSNTGDGNRRITWVKNEFFYWRGEDHGQAAARDVVVLLGAEPQNRWRTYKDAVMEVAGECNVELLLVVGSLLAQVPHTRPPRVAGSASRLELGPGLEHVKFMPPTYEGPSSMSSVLMEAMGQKGIPQASLWGQCPHYVQVAQNPAISHALLTEMQAFLPVKLNLSRMAKEAEQYNGTLARAIEGQKEISEYVKRLEREYDTEAARSQQPEAAGPEDVVKDLEEFLRRQRKQGPETGGERGT
jgi:proteasome assembly chaperone (PAC2) family protein